jgi:hypothetical protein
VIRNGEISPIHDRFNRVENIPMTLSQKIMDICQSKGSVTALVMLVAEAYNAESPSEVKQVRDAAAALMNMKWFKDLQPKELD